MTSLVGHAAAVAAFTAAMRGGSLHHAWLLAGPEGVGKATFARLAALRLLAEASGGPALPPGLAVPADHPTRALVEAGSHPDLRVLARLTKASDTGAESVARSITIDQVRGLLPMFATTPSLGARRVVVIDAIDDLERAGALLGRLHEAGCRTAIDDFGAGYSSLAYLNALPLDYLKLDRALVEGVERKGRERVVLRGVLQLARSLGLATVAEGVETPVQRDLLASEGCDFWQGFLCAGAVAADELARLTRAA